MPKTPIGTYDYGHSDPAKLKTFKIKSYDFKSQSDMPIRYVANFGDNGMADPSQVNEFAESDSVLDEIKDMLIDAGIEVNQIVDGIKLTPRGNQIVAGRLGIAAEDVPALLNSLVKKLSGDSNVLAEDEADPDEVRYSFEADFLDNVTVRDAHTGAEVFLDSVDGAELLHNLEGAEHGSEKEQSMLADAMVSHHDTVDESDATEPKHQFLKEIAANAGSFNFPWTYKGHSGIGMATYRGEGDDFHYDVTYARTDAGRKVKMTESVSDSLRKQAFSFLPKV